MSELCSFAGLSGDYAEYSRSKVVVLPIPFDKTCSWMCGARNGPSALLSASEYLEVYDIDTDSEVYSLGIHTMGPVEAETSEDMIACSYSTVKSCLEDSKFVVSLGGEHSVSIGPVRAYAEFYDDFSVLHLDAHSDRRQSYEGTEYSHACTVARMLEVTDNVVSVGIRSMDSSERAGLDESRMFYAHKIRKENDWIRQACDLLSENVYLTVDLDVFETSLMPSTGTPEPGGLDWYSVCDLIDHVIEHRNLVGFDVVELSPIEGNHAPDFLAAKLVYRTLCQKFRGKK